MFIDRFFRNVYGSIFEAVLLVSLVIFVFLRTMRASIIPIITIPVSLVGTFALMALAGAVVVSGVVAITPVLCTLLLKHNPKPNRFDSNVGNPTVAQASVIYRTVDWQDRTRSTMDMARECNPNSMHCLA